MPITQEGMLALYSSLFDQEEEETEPQVGDTKYIDGILHTYTVGGWVSTEEAPPEEAPPEEAPPEEAPPEETPVKEDIVAQTIDSIIINEPPIVEEKAEDVLDTTTVAIEKETIDDIVKKELPYRKIEIQIANIEEELENITAVGSGGAGAITAKLKRQLRILNREKDKLVSEDTEIN